jgi:GTP cyclohydrolase I
MAFNLNFLLFLRSGFTLKVKFSSCRTQKTSQFPHHREEKKERVKQCLRELNSLMPEGSQRKGLLGTLQQVVQRMKQIKGNHRNAII